LALYQSFEPDLYRFIYSNKWKKYFLFVAGYSVVLLVTVVLFISFSHTILSLLTSGRYTRASGYANIFVIGLAIQYTGGFFEPIFNARKQTKYILATNIVVGMFSVACYFFMIKWLGFRGANDARAMIGAFYLLASFSLYQLYRFRSKLD
jgi:O-antigen/teichoic acid export membrane protein